MSRCPTSAALFASLFIFVACSTTLANDPTFEADVLPILTKNCLGCHGGLRKRAGLDLRTIPSIVEGKILQPGNARASSMWQQIAADKMPRGEEKLSDSDKQIIKRWIDAGLPTVASRRKDAGSLLPAGTKHSPKEVASAIDQHIDRLLRAKKLKPVSGSSDDEFLRRVYVDITGRVPTAEQAAAFLDSDDADKRAKLIDALLERPEYGQQFGRTWRAWICPPELPSDGNGGRQPHKQARDLGEWIGDRLAKNTSWDKIVRQLLTSQGKIRNNPEIIFFGVVGQGGRVTPAGSTRAVASLFMGVQLQCAECHDDPYRAWSQQEFWGLAAFFGSTKGDFGKVTETPPKDGKNQVTIPRSAFRNAGTNVPAAFLRGDQLSLDSGGTLRPKFVDWLTHKDNPFFARAFANRLWFYFFARGIVNPVDDIRELNPPSHPGLLELLENEFAASGYDVKHLIRCICNSKAYQRTSRVAPGTKREEIVTLTEWFGRMPLRIMTADVLYDSLKLAYGDPRLDLRAIDPKDGNTNGESAPVADSYLQFLRDFGTNEDDATDFTHGIPQMLAMINHPRLLRGSKALDDFLKSKPEPTPKQTIEYLYLTTLSRRPTEDEAAEAGAYVNNAQDKKVAYVGVLWMLVNRSEFVFVR